MPKKKITKKKVKTKKGVIKKQALKKNVNSTPRKITASIIREKSTSSSNIKKTLVKKTYKTVARAMGMKDVAPAEFNNFNYFVKKAMRTAELYGFLGLKTPIIEREELFKEYIFNEKKLYKFNGDIGENCVLRPSLAPGILRAYIENELSEEPIPLRLHALGPVFKRERIHSNNFRETTQLDLEIIGEPKPTVEMLLIFFAYNFLKELNLDFQIQINSMGSFECQKEYGNRLNLFFQERGRKSKLCNNCKKSLGKEVINILRCKEDTCQELFSEAPQIANFLSEESRNHLSQALELLDELGVPYNFNPYLVKTLFYYNDIVFEFWPLSESGKLQSFYEYLGGGRYDKLIEILGGKASSAAGLAISLERVYAKIKNKIQVPEKDSSDLIFLAQLSNKAKIRMMKLFEELRLEGYFVRQSFSSNSLKSQLEEANKLKARYSLIMGKKEALDDTLIFRDMESGSQEIVLLKKIKEKLNKKIIRKEGVNYG